jgi:hypothetical protein
MDVDYGSDLEPEDFDESDEEVNGGTAVEAEEEDWSSDEEEQEHDED